MADDAVADRRQCAESGSVRGHAAVDHSTRPAAGNLRAQQRKFNRFWEEFNTERPHEALDMRTPAQLYSGSTRCRTGFRPSSIRIASRYATSAPTAGTTAGTSS